jgi:hypothetical protein
MDRTEAPLLQVVALSRYQDATDPRCPYEGWLQRFDLRIVGESSDEAACTRTLQIDILNAYQNGKITFKYEGVVGCRIALTSEETVGKIVRRCDWLEDEAEVIGSTIIRHSIRWETEECKIDPRKVTYNWIPNP